jgi:uncharacterized damage-inducible protein DinB
MSEIQRINEQLRQAFEGNAWHGPAVQELLADVTAARAVARPLPNAHNIWEIVLHMMTWERVVRRRLRGETIADLPPEQDWPAIQDASESAWRMTIQDLKQANHALREEIARTSAESLAETVLGKEHSVYTMLHGIIQHDLYHTGQVALLKRALS